MNRLTLPADAGESRLDVALAKHAPVHSRSRWQALIETGHVHVNGVPAAKCRMLVRGGDIVEWTEPAVQVSKLLPADIPLKVVFEDANLLVLDKAPGLVVHPSPGHEDETLVHALLHRIPELEGIGGEARPGIVHRLDRDTSGLLVVAKTESALRLMSNLFKSRQVTKEYFALVFGTPEPPRGEIRTLIGRSSADRKKMSTKVLAGRHAVTEYETLATVSSASALRVRILTGRTHQIRVHMHHIGNPIIGDRLYGVRKLESLRLGAKRQMLHAVRMRFRHPITNEEIDLESEIPEDMRLVMSNVGLYI